MFKLNGLENLKFCQPFKWVVWSDVQPYFYGFDFTCPGPSDFNHLTNWAGSEKVCPGLDLPVSDFLIECSFDKLFHDVQL